MRSEHLWPKFPHSWACVQVSKANRCDNSLKAGSGASKIYGCLVYRHSRAGDLERDLLHADGHC